METVAVKTISLEIDGTHYRVPLETELIYENGYTAKCSLQEELHEWFWHDLYTLVIHHKSEGWETITAYNVEQMDASDLHELSKFAPIGIGITLHHLARTRERD